MAVTSTCPACKRPIDPTHAPLARVRGTRVVTFCSTTCANLPEAEWGARDASDAPLDDAAKSGGLGRARPDSGYVEAERAPPRGDHKRRIIAISSAILAGGMIITIIGAVSPSSPTDVSAAGSDVPLSLSETRTPVTAAPGAPGDPAHPAADDSAAPDPLAEVDPEVLVERATTALREALTSPSPRLRRIAALALSRTGDEQALTALGELAERELSGLAKIEIAYALARAGDRESRKRLRRALTAERRDVRNDAARALVELGDPAGAKVLARMLSLRSHRLGAAELLARIGEPRGNKVLAQVLDDAEASREAKMRAAVALGLAGDDSVRDELKRILAEGDYQVGAASALAALGDSAATPALIKQLDVPSLRVRAATWLRRLGAEVDLIPLATALATDGTADQVTAAEAILILAGPKQLSERN